MSPIIPVAPTSGHERGAMSCSLIFLTIFATIGGFLFGYDTGVVSGVTLFWTDDSKLAISSFQIEMAVSITVGAAAVACALSGMPLQWYGRKPIIIVSCACYVMGSLVLAVAGSFAVLFTGRLLLGLGVGLSSIAVPVYLAELSPPAFRGRIVSSYTLSIVVGQASSCGVNILCDKYLDPSAKWRWALGIAAGPALVQLTGFLLGLPESPKWLASAGRGEEALAVLRRLRGPETSEAEVEADWRALEQLPDEDVGDLQALAREIWRTPHLRRIFGLGVGLQALQQLGASKLCKRSSLQGATHPSVSRTPPHLCALHVQLASTQSCM